MPGRASWAQNPNLLVFLSQLQSEAASPIHFNRLGPIYLNIYYYKAEQKLLFWHDQADQQPEPLRLHLLLLRFLESSTIWKHYPND